MLYRSLQRRAPVAAPGPCCSAEQVAPARCGRIRALLQRACCRSGVRAHHAAPRGHCATPPPSPPLAMSRGAPDGGRARGGEGEREGGAWRGSQGRVRRARAG